jgi:hypothetical protein
MVATALVAALALLFIALMNGAADPSTASAKTKTHHAKKHARKHHARAHTRAAQSATENGESSAEAPESGSSSEPAGGHEDAGNADHQCPPDCAPGEQP